jgi:hypothetical protein
VVGTVSPRSRQDEHNCCTEEEIEKAETIMSLGLAQRLDCDIDIWYDMD